MQVIFAVKSGSVVNGHWGLWPSMAYAYPKPPVSPETGPGGNHPFSLAIRNVEET